MIETRRLIIQPLTHAQLVQYVQHDFSLEDSLHVLPSKRSISPELKEALEQTIIPQTADSTKDFRYTTLWTAIDKEQRAMVGDLCIMGEPNAQGEIEIGYGTYEAFQGKGYMTEMVEGLLTWASTQPSVMAVLAATEQTNYASHQVLRRNGFSVISESAGMIHWKRLMQKRKVILYIAVSLDGYIAKPNDDLSFLAAVQKDGEDYGYAAFMETVDTVIVGRRTYDWVLQEAGEHPHRDKQVYVLTRSSRAPIENTLFYTGDVKDLIRSLQNQSGKHIYCEGGAKVVHELFQHDLLDELIISLIPVLVGDGIPLFSAGRPECALRLLDTKRFDSGLVQLHYQRVSGVDNDK